MPSAGMPSAIFSSMPRMPGNSSLSWRARSRTACVSSSSRLAGEVDRVNLAGQRPLIGDRERADLVDLVAEELDAVRVIGDRREDVEDAAAQGELASPRDHVDAVIGELDEPGGDLGEVVAAPADGEVHLDRVGEAGGERLQRAAHRGGDHERALAVPAGDAPQHLEAVPDGLGARAQPLVRQGLPGREVHHLGAREERFQRRAERLGAAPGRGDHEQRSGPPGGAAPFEQRSQQRGIQALDEREVRVDGRRGRGIPERVRLFEGAHDPGNCHRTSLRATKDNSDGPPPAASAPMTHRMSAVSDSGETTPPAQPASTAPPVPPLPPVPPYAPPVPPAATAAGYPPASAGLPPQQAALHARSTAVPGTPVRCTAVPVAGATGPAGLRAAAGRTGPRRGTGRRRGTRRRRGT